ncbi:hypothetical protein EON65_58110 [archaeon]|nr:MAG: hypothetical protein EON65_58110 [archaeon]
MRMNAAANCIFLFLQVVLAPILYPYGYLTQILGMLILGLHNKTIQERERQLLDPLLLILLLSNIVLSGELSIAHYAVRIAGVLLLCCGSSRLHDLSIQLMDPFVSVFMLIELLLSPHLYPNGYFAQLGKSKYVLCYLVNPSLSPYQL